MTLPKRLLLATRNEGKLRELRELLADLPLTLNDLDEVPLVDDVSETGETFVENAVLKASSYSTQTGLLTLSDDSGLEVDALGGAPGVRSARYVGKQAPDAARVERLLAEIAALDPAKRKARFVSVIAIADPEGLVLSISKGMCEGRIAFGPRGANGFGYDPIFIPDGYDLTFAELDTGTKNRISHRAQALNGARSFLKTLTAPSSAR